MYNDTNILIKGIPSNRKHLKYFWGGLRFFRPLRGHIVIFLSNRKHHNFRFPSDRKLGKNNVSY